MATVARNNLDIQIIQTQRGIIPDWGVASFVFGCRVLLIVSGWVIFDKFLLLLWVN
jgi:hypothetical protein